MYKKNATNMHLVMNNFTRTTMKRSRTRNLYILLTTAVVVCGVAVLLRAHHQSSPTPVSAIEKSVAVEKSAMLIVGALHEALPFTEGETLASALFALHTSGQLPYEGKEYSSLGFFVTDIGTLHADGGHYLVYFINGTEASVGVSSYVLHDHDVIEWKRE
jgi:hypothetical protein